MFEYYACVQILKPQIQWCMLNGLKTLSGCSKLDGSESATHEGVLA